MLNVLPYPFLKWAGGKRQHVPELLHHVPERFRRYHEPFLGGGALYFALAGRGMLVLASGERSWGAQYPMLSDVNAELVVTYRGIRSAVSRVIQRLTLLEERHCEEVYAQQRASDLGAGLVDGMQVLPGAVEVAARMIYLNKTCFNGLYRVNRAGEFNVPLDPSSITKHRRICDADGLALASAHLRYVHLHARDFEHSFFHVKAGDFVYADPPYVPLGGYSKFTGYAARGFGPEEQERLSRVASLAVERGAFVLLSNSDTPLARQLYPSSRWHRRRLTASRRITARTDRRSDRVTDLLIWPRRG